MLDSIFVILVPLFMVVVAAVLFAGIYSMFKGGEFNRKYSNKLMRLRVLFQLVAIVVVMIVDHHNHTHCYSSLVLSILHDSHHHNSQG